MNVDVVKIGAGVLPADLVAPFGGEQCCGGEVYLVDVRDVVAAFLRRSPIVCPSCATRYRPRDLGCICFVSRAEWEAAPADAAPQRYYIGHAFVDPGRRAA